MLKFYYSGAPNPTKVALFLEETGTLTTPFRLIPAKAKSNKPEFLAINPNAKLPAIVDGDVTANEHPDLLYLADKTGKFLPAKTDKARGEPLPWMFFLSSGVGPYFGQAIFTFCYSPENIHMPSTAMSSREIRHAGILDERLGKQK